jgi:inward rectifier potassium channel
MAGEKQFQQFDCQRRLIAENRVHLRMAFNRHSRQNNSKDNTGFGSNSNSSGGRFLDKDGRANVRMRGSSWFDRLSIYHSLLELPRWKFIGLIFLFFVVINLVFALLYFALEDSTLSINASLSPMAKFGQCFFFSAQTFTTVGYGHIAPQSFVGSAIAAAEALLGLLSFALATGLLYGRFAKPKAFIRFSSFAVVAPYQQGTGLMFRMTPYKNNYLTDVEVKVTLGMRVDENGKKMNRFYELPLEISKVNALSLSWTLVHAINEDSMVYGWDLKDFENASAEILVFVRAFDEAFSNTVIARTSYAASEVKIGAKFKQMYRPSEDGNSTILDIDQLDDVTMADVSAFVSKH